MNDTDPSTHEAPTMTTTPTTNGTTPHVPRHSIAAFREAAIEHAVARTTIAVRFRRDGVDGVGIGRAIAVTVRHVVLAGGARETVITLESVTAIEALDCTPKAVDP